MAQPLPKPALRPILPADIPFLAAIFSASIEDLTADDYSEEQRAAWAAAADDMGEFAARLSSQLVLVATVADAPVAFISLKGPDHIDMLYVHPGVARQGIATLLCDAIERLAAARGAAQLTVDASDTAVLFFDRRGFEPQQRNMAMVGGEWLGNTRMIKRLTKAEPKSVSQ